MVGMRSRDVAPGMENCGILSDLAADTGGSPTTSWRCCRWRKEDLYSRHKGSAWRESDGTRSMIDALLDTK